MLTPKHLIRPLTALSLWTVLCLPSLAQNSRDIVMLKAGGTESGEIVTVSPDYLTIKTKGGQKRIAVTDAAKVMFSDDPSGMTGVRNSVETANLAQAKKQLAVIKAKGRPFVLQDIEYYKAAIDARLALTGQASMNNAARQLASFLKSSSQSHHYYDACELMGQLAMSLQRYDKAASYFGKIQRSKLPAKAQHGMRLRADALLQEGKVEQAKKLYAQLAKAKDSTLAGLGSVGQALCMARSGQATAAVDQLEQLIRATSSEDQLLYARLYNALGEAQLQANDHAAALEAFLHTDLLFNREADAHAEALYHLQSLWSRANKPAEAGKARDLLRQRYAASRWAKK